MSNNEFDCDFVIEQNKKLLEERDKLAHEVRVLKQENKIMREAMQAIIDVHDHASIDTVPFIQKDLVLKGDLGIKQERVINWGDDNTMHYIAQYVLEELIRDLEN